MQTDVHEVRRNVLDAREEASGVRYTGRNSVFSEQVDEGGLDKASMADLQRVAKRPVGQSARFTSPG
jgi:hypothetical protein